MFVTKLFPTNWNSKQKGKPHTWGLVEEMRSVFLLKCIVFKPYTMWSLRIRENIKTFLNLKVCRVQKASENKLHQRRKIFPGTKPRQYTVKLITFLWIQKKIGRTRALFSLDVAPLSTPCLPTTFPTKPRKNSDRKIETNSRLL